VGFGRQANTSGFVGVVAVGLMEGVRDERAAKRAPAIAYGGSTPLLHAN
jgi:hypothetical protein